MAVRAREVPAVPVDVGRLALAEEVDLGAKLGEPNVAVGGLPRAEVVAEAEEEQGENGGEEGRERRDG